MSLNTVRFNFPLSMRAPFPLDQYDSAFLQDVLNDFADPTRVPSVAYPNAEELRCRTRFGATSRRSHTGPEAVSQSRHLSLSPSLFLFAMYQYVLSI